MDAIFRRTSVRKYAGIPVEPEKVERILRAAMAAPSAGDQRPWEFIVVRDAATIAKLAGVDPYSRCALGAPVVFAPCMRTRGLRFPEMAEIDMAIASENMLLEIVELGLGGVFLGIAPLKDRVDRVAEILGLGDELRPFAMIPCGYPASDAERSRPDRYDASRVRLI